MDMKISNIEIVPLRNPKSGLVGFCSFILNDSVYIGSVGIVTCLKNDLGYRLLYPTRKTLNGDLISCVYPINRNTGVAIERVVIAKYKAVVEDALTYERDEICFKDVTNEKKRQEQGHIR